MKKYVDDKLLPIRYYLIGDDAFVCHNQFLTPYSGRGLNCWKDSFSYYLSSMRQCIERAFGMLTKRWGIFWRPLSCQFIRWSLVVTAAAKLHNFCIESKFSEIPERFQGDVQVVGDVWETLDNNNNNENTNDNPLFNGVIQQAMGRREILKCELQVKGILRPTFAGPSTI
jgi:hypothetical protein